MISRAICNNRMNIVPYSITISHVVLMAYIHSASHNGVELGSSRERKNDRDKMIIAEEVMTLAILLLIVLLICHAIMPHIDKYPSRIIGKRNPMICNS